MQSQTGRAEDGARSREVQEGGREGGRAGAQARGWPLSESPVNGVQRSEDWKQRGFFLNASIFSIKRSWGHGQGWGTEGQRRFMEGEKIWNGSLRKVRKCLKTPRRNHRSVLGNLGLGNGLSDTIPKAQMMKEKLDKLDYVKIKNPCAVNSTKKVTRKLRIRICKLYIW